MEPVEWHLYQEFSSVDHPELGSSELKLVLDDLKDLGVGSQVGQRIQAALAAHLVGNAEPLILLYVSRNWQAAIPPPEGWQFFIVAHGEDKPTRLELYLY